MMMMMSEDDAGVNGDDSTIGDGVGENDGDEEEDGEAEGIQLMFCSNSKITMINDDGHDEAHNDDDWDDGST